MIAVYVIGLENILINQVISYKEATNALIMLRNTDGGEMWGWSKEANDSYNANIIIRTFWKVWSSLKIFLGMFLLSSITSIYIKMTIISAPLFIIAALRCNQQPNAQTASAWLHIYRSFPWVGMYLYALSFQYRHLQKYILVAFGLMILVFYCVFLASVSIWGYLLFFKALPKGIDENFYGFVAFLELLVLLFLRTRSTLKHYPIVANTIMFTFLLYVSQTQYGFYYLGLYNVIIAVVGFLAYNLIKFEIPALNWNLSHPHTPSIQKPRCLYFPAFSVSWVSDLPQLWTMFFPLVGRDAFNTQQMAFVDRDQQAMQQLMESHQNQEYPVEAQEAATHHNNRQGDNSTANSQRELVADEASTNRSPGIPTANQNDSPSTSSPQINPGNHSILDIIQDHILPAHDSEGLNERILNSPEDAAVRDMELGDPSRLVRPTNNNNTTSSSSTGSGNSYQRLNN
jgi:signal transduction histidine kinase